MKLTNLLKSFNSPEARSKMKERYGKKEITDEEEEKRKKIDEVALKELKEKLNKF